MKRKPRDPNEGIFSGGSRIQRLLSGCNGFAILTLAAYFIGERIENGAWRIVNSEDGMTMAFLTMSMAEIFHSYNMRSQYNSIFSVKNHNFYFLVRWFSHLFLLRPSYIYRFCVMPLGLPLLALQNT
jgi:Ca2+-transporting ATPase